MLNCQPLITDVLSIDTYQYLSVSSPAFSIVTDRSVYSRFKSGLDYSLIYNSSKIQANMHLHVVSMTWCHTLYDKHILHIFIKNGL